METRNKHSKNQISNATFGKKVSNYETTVDEEKGRKFEEFDRRAQEYQKKKEEKISVMQQSMEQQNTFRPKILKQKRSVDCLEREGGVGERLYEQGRQLSCQKEEFQMRIQMEEKMKQGKPEINQNTTKILEQKAQRTGESYMAPHDKKYESSKYQSMQQSF